VVVFALLLVNRAFWARLRAHAIWLTGAVVIAGLYYSLGVAFIDRYRESPSLFALGWRPFLPSLLAFVMDGRDLARLLFYRSFFAGGILLVAGIWIWQAARGERKVWPPLAAVFTLQLLFIAGLSGLHAYGHDYYFVGLAPVCALGLVGIFATVRSRAAWGLMVALALVPFFETNIASVKALLPSAGPAPTLGLQCEKLRRDHPEIPWGQALVFRAPAEDYPVLGLCFGERVAAPDAPWGFFYAYSPLPADCAVVGKSAELRLVKCEKKI
jgi:hypothetical protein